MRPEFRFEFFPKQEWIDEGRHPDDYQCSEALCNRKNNLGWFPGMYFLKLYCVECAKACLARTYNAELELPDRDLS